MVFPCPQRRREEEEDEKEEQEEERRLQHLQRHKKKKTASSGTISDEMTERKKRADVALVFSRGCRPSCVGVGWVGVLGGG